MHVLELLRKSLNRMPRRVSTAHSRRAGVVLPLCNVDGVPCILFEKRSPQLRAHPDEVCLPGGMVSEGGDKSIVQTCLREMEEEIGFAMNAAHVIGVLRCNWGEVHHLVGVAVTPVVCFLGELEKSQLKPNPDEVAECFTVPLQSFLDPGRWAIKFFIFCLPIVFHYLTAPSVENAAKMGSQEELCSIFHRWASYYLGIDRLYCESICNGHSR